MVAMFNAESAFAAHGSVMTLIREYNDHDVDAIDEQFTVDMDSYRNRIVFTAKCAEYNVTRTFHLTAERVIARGLKTATNEIAAAIYYTMTYAVIDASHITDQY